MPLKFSALFALTTTPTNLAQAQPHSGGWSESIWDTANTPTDVLLSWEQLLDARAALLPINASIIGYRIQQYTISVNKFLPGGTSGAKLLLPGNELYTGDLPQVSLMLSASSNNAQNTRRFTLRGMPDSFMVGGEFQPTAPYLARLTNYRTTLQQGNWYFPGRDLAQPERRVLSIAGNVVNVDNAVGFVQGGYLRFHRCTADNGNVVEGSYPINLIVGTAITLGGLPATTLTKPSGTCRNDVAILVLINTVTAGRAVVRKIGRPFELYRGRRSKRPA